MKTMILVVEDDKAVRNLITTTLETQGYAFVTAEKGSDAISAAVSYRPDVMILDLGLPDIDGVEIIKKVRSWSNNPIIVVSARSEDRDKIDALETLQCGGAFGPHPGGAAQDELRQQPGEK